MDLKIENLKGKKVAILGLWSEGLSLVEYFSTRGHKVIAAGLYQEKDRQALEEKVGAELITWVRPGGETSEVWEADFILKTSQYHGFVGEVSVAKKKGIMIASDLDFASHNCRGKKIGITGTNGKSTTCEMIRAILEAAGKKVHQSGNFFNTFLSAAEMKADYYLFETSTSTLDRSDFFHPHISLFTTFSPNHPERHENMQDYLNSKLSITKNQGEADFFIYHKGAPLMDEAVDKLPFLGKCLPVTDDKREGAALYYSKGVIYFNFQKAITVQLKRWKFHGFHNVQNAMMAVGVGVLCGIGPKVIEAALSQLEPLPFRFQKLATYSGIEVFNDGMANSTGATAWALNALQKNVVLISGGAWSNGMGFASLRGFLKDHAKVVILYGSDRRRFFECWKDYAKIYLVDTLKEATQLAFEQALRGDKILFSPAAKEPMGLGSYEGRGAEFSRYAADLAEYYEMKNKLGRQLR